MQILFYLLVIAIAGNCTTSIHAISRNEAAGGAAGIAGIAILTTLLVEHTIVPLITGSAQKQAAQRKAAQHTQKQEEARETCHDIEQHYGNITPPTDSMGLIAHKEGLTRDIATVDCALELFKKELAEHAKYTALFTTLQNKQKDIDGMISEQVSQEMFATYEEELEKLKTSKGLDKQTLDRIIVEQHVREPYRSTTYLDRIEQALANCKQYNAPSSVINLLEILRRRTSRLLEPDIVRERKAYEAAMREQQEFDVKIAGQRATKDFYETAQQHVQTASQKVAEAEQQMAHFSAAMQQQHDSMQKTLRSCETHATRTLQNIADLQTIIALAHDQQQKKLEDRMVRTENAIHQEARQTRETVRTESRDVKRKLDHGEANPEQHNPPPYNPEYFEPDPHAPSAPPIDD